MEAYLLEWANLIGRWAHMITGIAWIGASFYFVWLDNHLQAPVLQADTDKGISGEVWSVHGGGFYHAQKYQVAPAELPPMLHWFKWEAYTTFLTGLFMLALMYWYGAELYLIDPGVMSLSKPVAIVIGMATLVLGWIVYDRLCHSKLGSNDLHLGIVMFVLLVLVAYGLCQVFSGRGAYMHFGSMLGTIMVANVFFVIIPGQKDLVTAKLEGRSPDPIHGIRGKQRSVHNTYFTLPVLLVMISNHYAMTYAHEWNWLILIALSLAGALVRVYFVQRHKGKGSPLVLGAAAALLGAVIWALAPKSETVAVDAAATGTTSAAAGVAADTPIAFSEVQGIVIARCAGCHAAVPSYPGFIVAPKGIVLDSADTIFGYKEQIYQQSVVTKAMPIGNLTGMTDDERATIGAWLAQGAPVE